MAEEAFDTRDLVEALRPERDADFFPLNDLPNDVLVSVFIAVGDPNWVRHTVPLVCKDWAALYLTKDASPLHEELEVDFEKEVKRAWQEWLRLVARPVAGAATQELAPYRPVVHASRVIEWTRRRAGSVRKLRLEGAFRGALGDFSAEDLGTLVAVVGSSLSMISIRSQRHECGPGELCKRPFWESLRTSVAPAGRLRRLSVWGIDSAVSESDVEPLGQLAGSLEELELATKYCSERTGLPRFPESLCALTELRRLVLAGQRKITAIPAEISSLKKLEELSIGSCNLSSLPKELGELSGLTKLFFPFNPNLGTPRLRGVTFPAELGNLRSLRDLSLRGCGLRAVQAFVSELKSLEFLNLNENNLSSLPKELGELSRLILLNVGGNQNLGNLPQEEAFPSELGRMKSLQELFLRGCGLSSVPAFVGELKSLQALHLDHNEDLEFRAPLDFLIDGCPRLHWVYFSRGREWTPESLAHLEAFEAKLLAKNPYAEVFF